MPSGMGHYADERRESRVRASSRGIRSDRDERVPLRRRRGRGLTRSTGLGAFVAQVVRWCAPVGTPARRLVGVEARAARSASRSSTLKRTALRRPSSRSPHERRSASRCLSPRSRASGRRDVRSRPGRPAGPPRSLRRRRGPEGPVPAAAPLGAPPEARDRGGDAARLDAIARELGATLAAAFPDAPPETPPAAPKREPIPLPWLWGLLPLLVDIVLGRLYPPRSR
jgi:hypothetical protein